MNAHPLLHFKVSTLNKDWELLLQCCVHLSNSIIVVFILQAPEDLAVQLQQVVNIDALDVARQCSQLGPQHGLQGLLGLLQVPAVQVKDEQSVGKVEIRTSGHA